MSRLDVKKTYKLYIGGEFPRSESGRSYVVNDAKGRFLANAAQASRKDARDAVKAARAAFGGWSGRTAYNRGQVVYRIAEVLEGRRDQFEAELRSQEGVTAARARTFVDAGDPPIAVDQAVFTDGLATISVFIEPAEKNTRKEGAGSTGATHVLVKRRGDYWITVLGEVPPATLQQFASAIEYKASK